MIDRLIRRLLRDRRRIAVVSGLLFAAGFVEFFGFSHALPFMILELMLGFAMVMFFGTLFWVIATLMPRWRHALVPMAFTLFASACLGRLFPQSAFSLMTITDGGLRGFAGLFITGVLAQFLFYGRWSDTVFRARRSRMTTRIVTHLDPDSLWYGIMPTPGRRECLHDPKTVSVDYVNRERSEIRVIEWAPPEDKIETLLKIDEIKTHSYAVYRFQKPGKHPGEKITGLRALRVVDMGEHQVLYVTEFRQNRPLRKVFFDWLDNSLNRREYARIANLEAAVASMGANRQMLMPTLRIGGTLKPRKSSSKRGALLQTPEPLHLTARRAQAPAQAMPLAGE